MEKEFSEIDKDFRLAIAGLNEKRSELFNSFLSDKITLEDLEKFSLSSKLIELALECFENQSNEKIKRSK